MAIDEIKTWHDIALKIGKPPFVAINATCNPNRKETAEQRYDRNKGHLKDGHTGWWSRAKTAAANSVGHSIVFFLRNPRKKNWSDVYLGRVARVRQEGNGHAFDVAGKRWRRLGVCHQSFTAFMDGIAINSNPVVVWVEETSILDSAQNSEDSNFDPTSKEDGRRKIDAQINARRGQGLFRKILLDQYAGQCAISGCRVESVLDAAHIVPYKGEHTNHVTNGLLLRTDIHTLFDLGLIAINPQSRCVHVSSEVARVEPKYRALVGTRIRSPRSIRALPDTQALQLHWDARVP